MLIYMYVCVCVYIYRVLFKVVYIYLLNKFSNNVINTFYDITRELIAEKWVNHSQLASWLTADCDPIVTCVSVTLCCWQCKNHVNAVKDLTWLVPRSAAATWAWQARSRIRRHLSKYLTTAQLSSSPLHFISQCWILNILTVRTVSYGCSQRERKGSCCPCPHPCALSCPHDNLWFLQVPFQR